MGRATRYDGTAMDPVRQRILGLVAQNRSNLRMASLAIGRNAAYLHQFIHRGTPRVLAEDDREALAKHLGCSPEEIKHGRPPSGEARPQPPSADPRAVPMGYSAVARDRRPRGGGPRGPGTKRWSRPRRRGFSPIPSSGMNSRPGQRICG